MPEATWELGRTETQTTTPPDNYGVMLVPPTDGTAPVLRSFRNFKNDIDTDTVLYRGEWVEGVTVHVGDQMSQENRVWVSKINHTTSTLNEPTGGLGYFSWEPLYNQLRNWDENIYWASGDLASWNSRVYLRLFGGRSAVEPSGSSAYWLDLARPGSFLWAQQGNTTVIPASKLPDLAASASATNWEIRYAGEATGQQITLATDSTCGLLSTGNKQLLDRLADMEARLDDAMIWRGEWVSGSTYSPNDVVFQTTGEVSHYIRTGATAVSSTAPGADSANWRRLH